VRVPSSTPPGYVKVYGISRHWLELMFGQCNGRLFCALGKTETILIKLPTVGTFSLNVT
jgi:hypothetical protein